MTGATVDDPLSGNPLSGLSVLVIEDEPFTRTVTSRVVAGLGCAAVHEAGDAVTGLDILGRQRIDAVVCDIDMRPLTGLDLLRRLRTSDDPGRRYLPLIFLTGRADPADVAAAAQLGHTSFLLKPVQPALLRETLEHHCGGANPALSLC